MLGKVHKKKQCCVPEHRRTMAGTVLEAMFCTVLCYEGQLLDLYTNLLLCAKATGICQMSSHGTLLQVSMMDRNVVTTGVRNSCLTS